MEDIQDGIKTSIQDGVTEDPEKTFSGKKLITLAYDYGTATTAKEMTGELETSTDSEGLVATMATVLGTVVA